MSKELITDYEKKQFAMIVKKIKELDNQKEKPFFVGVFGTAEEIEKSTVNKNRRLYALVTHGIIWKKYEFIPKRLGGNDKWKKVKEWSI